MLHLVAGDSADIDQKASTTGCDNRFIYNGRIVMPINDVLVYVDNDKACSDRLLAAARLCMHFDAHLAGLYIQRKIIVPSYTGMEIPVEVFVANDEMTKNLHESAKTITTEMLRTTGVSGEFRAVDGDVSHTLNVHSRYADLLIVPRLADEDQELNPHYHIDDLLLGAACPVLVVPEDSRREWPLRRALVAWDGGLECARALKAALPLLLQADKVDVVSVASGEIEAMDITLHISRHGIDAELHFVEGSTFDPGAELLATAASLESQFLVMGAYGHSRLREVLLGGATKHVLDNATLPVLFSH
jgi:nucleotide-binding universal stress UspA family protein